MEQVLNKVLFLLLLTFALSFAQKRTVGVLPSIGNINETHLNILTMDLRSIAANNLPSNTFAVMAQETIMKRIGGAEKYLKACREAEGCIADLGKKAEVDYVARCNVNSVDGKLIMNVELYNSNTGALVGAFDSFEESPRKLDDLRVVIRKKAPSLFGKIPGAVSSQKEVVQAPSVPGGISVKKSKSGELNFGSKIYLVNVSTEPEQGAGLIFNGDLIPSCTKTPCKAELNEGNVRISAALEQYEKADTTIAIRQNNQNVVIRLKPNYGTLEIKPAFLDGIGKTEQWSLAIDNKKQSSLKNRLSPKKYDVKLSHKCYEDITLDVGIIKGKNEVFDMANHLKLKQGGLILSATKDGSPISETVFVNGKKVGETPFQGSVSVCAEIMVGKEKIDVKIVHKETVRHTYVSNILVDSRDGKKYKTVKIGNQVWMAENVNYEVSGSLCYDNKKSNCDKYGRLYDWETAKTICPRGWHLPSRDEWETLRKNVGNDAGTKLKAKNGWNEISSYYGGGSGNGTDNFGFAALPGGEATKNNIIFQNQGWKGRWWRDGNISAGVSMTSDLRDLLIVNTADFGFSSVRCIQSNQKE